MKSFEHPIYMNNAATSWPKPPQVAEAVFEALSTMPGETNRGGVADFDVFEEVRTELASLSDCSGGQLYLGAEPGYFRVSSEAWGYSTHYPCRAQCGAASALYAGAERDSGQEDFRG